MSSLDYYPIIKELTRDHALAQLCENKIINEHKCGNCEYSDKFYIYILRKIVTFFNKKEPDIIEDKNATVLCICFFSPKTVIDKPVHSKCSYWKDYRQSLDVTD